MKKTGLWTLIIVCAAGSLLMIPAFINSGNPMALVNIGWGIGLIAWAVSLLRERDPDDI